MAKVTHHLEAKAEAGRWSSYVLDTFIAPELSKLSANGAPELPPAGYRFGSFVLNNVFTAQLPERTRALAAVFIYRARLARSEYELGRQRLADYVSTLSSMNTRHTPYLDALGHFEQCIIATYVGLMTFRRCMLQHDPAYPKVFERGDGSSAARIHVLYSAIKHFEDKFQQGDPDASFPVWITNTGLRGGALPKERVDLSFVELVEHLVELDENAKFLSEDLFNALREKAQQQGIDQ